MEANQPTTDDPPVSPFSTVAVADTNAARGMTDTANIVTVSFSASNGTLTDPNAASDDSTSAAGTYTVDGSAAAVQADLRGLLFTPTDHEVAPRPGRDHHIHCVR